MKKFAVVVGGGKGIRVGNEIPKQFLSLLGKPILFHTLEKFIGIADEIILVLPESQFEYWNKISADFKDADKVKIVAGGNSRSQSVKNGLRALFGQGIVAVHDGVRPLVSTKLISDLFIAAQKSGNAIPCIPVKESIRQKTGNSSRAVNRDDFFVVQTPQCFDLHQLISAYEKAGTLEFSDDAGLMEHFGTEIYLVDGEASNIKITFKEDIAIAEALINARNL